MNRNRSNSDYGTLRHRSNSDYNTLRHRSFSRHDALSIHRPTSFRTKDLRLTTEEGRALELLSYDHDHVFWRVYRTSCQLRLGYFSFLVLMVIVMFSFTVLMELFFAIFLPSAKFDTYYYVRAVVFLVCLPVVVFMLSYFFEEGARFFIDAVNTSEGSLPNFRLALAVLIHFLRHRKDIMQTNNNNNINNSSMGSITDARKHTPDQEETTPLLSRRASIASMLFINCQDDPFFQDDHAKEKEVDATWERLQEYREPTSRSAEQLQRTASSRIARKRWRRIIIAVQAAISFNKVRSHARPIDLSTFMLVDFLCPVLFEVATALAFVVGLLRSLSIPRAFLAYVRMGFWCVGFYVVLWILAHFGTSRHAQMRAFVSNYRRHRRVLRAAVNGLQRAKRAERQLWLLGIGFRFYHHIGDVFHPISDCKQIFTTKVKSDDLPSQMQDKIPLRVPPTKDDDAVTEEIADNILDMEAIQQYISLKRIQEVTATLDANNPWYMLPFNLRVTVLWALLLAAAMVSLVSFMAGWPFVCICMIALSAHIQRRFPQIFGSAFRYFIITFALLSLVFFASSFLIGTFVTGGKFTLGPFVNTTVAEDFSTQAFASNGITLEHARPNLLGDVIPEYPVCTVDYSGLTMLDLALIADAAYGQTTSIQMKALRNRFNGTLLDDWEYVARNNVTREQQGWMEIYFPTINMTVIGVRGTASVADTLEDMHYWFGIVIMQVANVFIPFLKQLPQEFVVKLLALNRLKGIMPAPVYQNLVDHVKDVKERVGSLRVVLTGHSLGGAMAAVAGAKTKTRVVSFSGPGLLYSRGRFGLEEQNIRDYVLTIKPRKDLIPMVDELGGMIQEIHCKHSNPLRCHKIFTHLCELYFSCGDKRHRNWATNEECQEYNNLPAIDDDSDDQ